MTKTFTDYNGTVVEKYDVTDLKAPHKVTAEYGNQGLGFEYAPQEGYVILDSYRVGGVVDLGSRFGWTNASYLYGLSLMSPHAKRALGANADYASYAEAKKEAVQV